MTRFFDASPHGRTGMTLAVSALYALFLLYMVAVVPYPIFIFIPSIAIFHHAYFLYRLWSLRRSRSNNAAWPITPMFPGRVERMVFPFGAASLCGLSVAFEVLCVLNGFEDDTAGAFVVQAITLFYGPQVILLGIVTYLAMSYAKEEKHEMEQAEGTGLVLFERVRNDSFSLPFDG
jgi:hypothetical protein